MKRPMISVYAWLLKDQREAMKAERELRLASEAQEDEKLAESLLWQSQAAASRADLATQVITGLQGLGYLDNER